MKNSAWYNSLWRKKLSELPVKEDPAVGWAAMKALLDVQLPVGGNGQTGNGLNPENDMGTGAGTATVGSPVGAVKGITALKSLAAKLIAWAGYTIPVAAVIGVAAYVVLPGLKQDDQQQLKKKQDSALVTDSLNSSLSGIGTDTLVQDSLRDQVNLSGDTAAEKQLMPGKNETGPSESGQDLQSTASKIPNGIRKNTDQKIKASGETGIKRETAFLKKTKVLGKEQATPDKKTSAEISVAKEAQVLNKKRVLQEEKATPDLNRSGETSTAKETQAQDKTRKLQREKAIQNTKASGEAKLSGAIQPSGEISASEETKIQGNKKSKLNSKIKKTPKSPTGTGEITDPVFNFGLEGGFSAGKSSSFYAGVLVSYQLRMRMLLNAGIRLNTSSAISGSYTTGPTHVLGDSTTHHLVTDSRKTMSVTVPLTLEYRLTNRISVNAGAVVNFPVKPSGSKSTAVLINSAQNQVSTAYMDSVRLRAVDSTLNFSRVSTMNLGVTGGISLRIGRIYLDAQYLQSVTPYKVSTDLGGYKHYGRTVQVGLRYKFKK